MMRLTSELNSPSHDVDGYQQSEGMGPLDTDGRVQFIQSAEKESTQQPV